MSEEQKPEQPAPVQRLFVYVGQCRVKGGAKAHEYHMLTDEQYEAGKLPPADDTKVWKKPLGYSTFPGSVIRVDVELKDDGNVVAYGRTARYVGRWHDEAKVLEWNARETARRAEAKGKRLASVDPLLEALLPMQRAIGRLSAGDRAAAITKVVRFLSGYGTKVTPAAEE